MATKSYNLGRVVGWSSYEEFLKENPDVDPSIVTAQRYYSATTYGISRIVNVPTTGWSGTNILTKTVAVPGAIWGVVPILGLCYDEAQGMVPGTGADTNKQNYERAASNIFACYVSDIAGNKVTNATSDSGYLTFCAYPALNSVTGVTSLPFIVRGLGVEALTDNLAYWGPEGIVNGAGNAGMADGVITGFTPLSLSDGSMAYIIEMSTQDRDSGTSTTRRYLSFAGPDGTAYNPAGTSGNIPLQVSTSGAANGLLLLDWDDLLRALVENKSLGFDLYDAIAKILQGDGDGIEVTQNSTTKKVIINNLAPYFADESHYETLKQGRVDLSTLPTGSNPDAYKNCDYVIDAFHQGSADNHNNFVSYCGTDSAWSDDDANLSGLLHPGFSSDPLICYVRAMKSKVMVTYNGVEYPKSVSLIIGGVTNHKFDDDITRQFYLGKKSRYTSGGAVTRTGFFYDDSDTSRAPAFAFLHTDDKGSVGRIGSGSDSRWYHGQYSWLFGVSFFGTNVVGDDYKFIHDMIEAGHYKLTDTTQGSSGIWNMKSVLGGSLGATWGGNAQVHLGKDVLWNGTRQCASDILVLASSYADGYNTQMARWTKDSDVHGADLYSEHINLKVSCTLTWTS